MSQPRTSRRKPRLACEALEGRSTPAPISAAAIWAGAMRAPSKAEPIVAPPSTEALATRPADSVQVQILFRVKATPILHITPNIPFDPTSGTPPRLGSPIGVGATPWIEASPDGKSYRVGATPTYSIQPSIPFDPAAGAPPDLGPPLGLRVETLVEIDAAMRPFDPQNPAAALGPTIHLIGPSQFKINLVPESTLRS